MTHVYFPGDHIFLYAAFQKGINIISEHKGDKSAALTDNSKYGFYINGEYVTYEDYYRYYSGYYTGYLIDSDTSSTYYSYYSYYTQPFYNVATGNTTFNYYVRAMEDMSEEDDGIVEITTHKMQCRILHDEDGTVYEDLPWTDMLKMSDGEFYYNFLIPYEFSSSQYQVIYKSIYNVSYFDKKTKKMLSDEELDEINFNKHNVNRIAHTMESFYVVNRVAEYEDVVKVFGRVNYQRSTFFAEDVRISIYEQETNRKAYQSLTDREGYWEAYLYPGQYVFVFSRLGYNTETIYAEVNDDVDNLPFETVSLGNGLTTKGTGLYKVGDKYITKTGQPLNGLTITVADIRDPSTVIAADTTNDEGMWELYLDDGFYIMKISGTSMGAEFKRTFRLRVNQDGEFWFENLSTNILTDANMKIISNGTGKYKISDYVKDRWNNPIVDVQVNVYQEGVEVEEENIFAQDYTDGKGRYTLQLDPGTYTFEFYHPNFTTFTETHVIDSEGKVTIR